MYGSDLPKSSNRSDLVRQSVFLAAMGSERATLESVLLLHAFHSGNSMTAIYSDWPVLN